MILRLAQMPFFTVDVLLIPEALLLDPSHEVTTFIFRQVMDLWEDDVKGIQLLIGDQIYHPFTK